MALGDLCTTDFKNQPYWWDLAAPEPISAGALPATVEVAIVGSGLTGISAALTLLRAGRSVVVLDSEDPGFGASRRNAGYIGRTLKKSFPELMEAKGREHALTVYRELDNALQLVRTVIAEEGIDCYLAQCGRFIGATSPAHYDDLARNLEVTKQHLGFDYHMVSRDEQRREFESPVYYGGAVIPDLGSLHPGLYHKGLLARVLEAGGQVFGRTPVLSLRPESAGTRVETGAGSLIARDVIVATNGYTPRQLSWHARRVVPFTGYMGATEILPEEVVRRVIPLRRTVIDTNMNIDYVRPAPDTARLLFGGSTGARLETPEAIATRLQSILRRLLPDLGPVRLSHIWTGRCAGTLDMMPHLGRHEGVWYAMGYNFAGVPMGTYMGRKLAEQILGRPEGRSVFGEASFRALPLYDGNPWFVPLLMRYYTWRDHRKARKAA